MTDSTYSKSKSIFEYVPGWNIDRLHDARILVVGAGALGNEVLKNLALLGVGEITIIDFDRIEASNLSRSILFREADTGELKSEVAARSVKELNPSIKSRFINGDILCDVGLGLMRESDLIFGCLDNRLARLWLNRWAFRAGKSWIGGGILNLSGQATVYKLGELCYECTLDKSGWKDIQHRLGCTDMAQRYFNAGIQPTTPISASIIGAVMVQEGLKLLFEQDNDRLKGQMWSYEGQTLHSAVYNLSSPKQNCFSHYPWPAPEKVPGLSRQISVADAMRLFKDKFGGSCWVELDHPIALEVATMTSNRTYPFVKPLLHLSHEIADTFRKFPGEGIGVPPGKLISRLDEQFPNAEMNFVELGFPDFHILRVNCNGKNHFVELTS